jgi:alkylated DNA repair dioxygenase AlkB
MTSTTNNNSTMTDVVCVHDDAHSNSYFVQIPNFLSEDEIAYYSTQVHSTTDWKAVDFPPGPLGRTPRLQKWFQDDAHYFSPYWSNQGLARWKSSPTTDPWLLQLRSRVQTAVNRLFETQTLPDTTCRKPDLNSTLINYYRDGNDSIRYHKDDEKIFGANPTIAMLTFGCPRELKFKWTISQNDRSEPGFPTSIHENDKTFNVSPGTLFIMAGAVQKCYWHGVERDPSICEPRYSLTFRQHFHTHT